MGQETNLKITSSKELDNGMKLSGGFQSENGAVDSSSIKLSSGAISFEIGADTSKIAMGGVMGQCCEHNGKLKPLFYWNGVLTPAQSQWHPYNQEMYGLLHMRRECVKHFGRIPAVIHTDHALITRLEYLPLGRIEAKHFRWYAELTQDGSLLLYRAGTGACSAWYA